MFLSKKSVNKVTKNVYMQKEKSSCKTNYGKDLKKPPSAPVKKKKRHLKKVEKQKIYDKNN